MCPNGGPSLRLKTNGVPGRKEPLTSPGVVLTRRMAMDGRDYTEGGLTVPSFKELSAEEIRRILDARTEKGEKLYEDILTPLVEKEDRLFETASCPKCHSGATRKVINTHRPFVSGSPLPNMIARCVACGTEFDPKTGLITLANLIDE